MAEHIGRDAVLVPGMADADAHAPEVGAEVGVDRAQAVVPRGAAADLHLDLHRREVELVVEHRQRLEVELVEAQRRGDRLAALFVGFGDSALNFELRVWVREIQSRLQVRSSILTDIDRRFREAGIEIPFPHQVAVPYGDGDPPFRMAEPQVMVNPNVGSNLMSPNRIFQREGLETFTASNGTEALELLRRPELRGKPVEELVRDHPATTLALAAMRPPRTVSTFSVWRSLREMSDMVRGLQHNTIAEFKRSYRSLDALLMAPAMFGFNPMLHVTQALCEMSSRLYIVTRNAQSVLDGDPLNPVWTTYDGKRPPVALAVAPDASNRANFDGEIGRLK